MENTEVKKIVVKEPISQNSDKAKKLIQKKEKKEIQSKGISFDSIGKSSKIEQIANRKKEFLYKFQISPDFQKLSESQRNKEGKRKRTKFRNKLISLLDSIEIESKLFANKQKKDRKDLVSSIKDFLSFFSETYINQNLFNTEKFSSLEKEKQQRINSFLEAIRNELKTNSEIKTFAKNKKIIFE